MAEGTFKSTLEHVWYREKDVLGVGGVHRYTVTYLNKDPNKDVIYFRLKNIERSSMRAFQIFSGPFTIYCHVVPYGYNSHRKFKADNPKECKELVFENQLQPGLTFNVKLLLNENSLKEVAEEGYSVHQWEIDLVSQIVLNSKGKVYYDFMVGDDFECMKKLNHGIFLNSLFAAMEGEEELPLGEKLIDDLNVDKQVTEDIWTLKPKNPNEPIHLVILTHGIFSNLTADMLYIRDQLYNRATDNVVIQGYSGNVGKSEKGIKRLGSNMGKYLITLIKNLGKDYNIEKISFIGHSLGGLTQLYAIKYVLQEEGPDFFSKRNIQPYNLVSMASPLLGVLSEMSFWISWFLDLGTLGKTGRDLTLSKKIPTLMSWKNSKRGDSFRPVLETLPNDPLQTFLTQFKKLTLYANAINDGIVPLRTSALLYLDYEALGDVNTLIQDEHKLDHVDTHLGLHPIQTVESDNSNKSVGEIPMDKSELGNDSKIEKRFENFLSLNMMGTLKRKPNKLHYPKLKKLDQHRSRRLRAISVRGSSTPVLSSDSESESSQSDDINNSNEYDEDDNQQMSALPKASAVESALSTLISPIPPYKYFTDPEGRASVIFHDKYYHFKNLPSDDQVSSHGKFEKIILNYNDWKLQKQVNIVKKYHIPKLNWRKVLVNLPPDAHNNILVRRRFSNGYGWGVIDHLCTELFTDSDDLVRAKM